MKKIFISVVLVLIALFTLSVSIKGDSNVMVNEDIMIYGNGGYHTVRSVHCGSNQAVFDEDDFTDIYVNGKHIWLWYCDVMYVNNATWSNALMWSDCGYGITSYSSALNDIDYGIFDYQGKIGFYMPSTYNFSENNEISYYLNVVANYDFTYVCS